MDAKRQEAKELLALAQQNAELFAGNRPLELDKYIAAFLAAYNAPKKRWWRFGR